MHANTPGINSPARRKCGPRSSVDTSSGCSDTSIVYPAPGSDADYRLGSHGNSVQDLSVVAPTGLDRVAHGHVPDWDQSPP